MRFKALTMTAVLLSPTRPSRNGCWFLEMRLMSILLYGTLFDLVEAKPVHSSKI